MINLSIGWRKVFMTFKGRQANFIYLIYIRSRPQLDFMVRNDNKPTKGLWRFKSMTVEISLNYRMLRLLHHAQFSTTVSYVTTSVYQSPIPGTDFVKLIIKKHNSLYISVWIWTPVAPDFSTHQINTASSIRQNCLLQSTARNSLTTGRQGAFKRDGRKVRGKLRNPSDAGIVALPQ